jgi:diacylglycerol kinase family enzyme
VSQVDVEADPAQPLETDGDHHPAGRLEVSVVHAALTVIVPPDQH